MAKARKRLKSIPKFASEAEERAFWETHDTIDYIDWSDAQRVTFPNLKPSTETISLRLPAPLLGDLKALANKRDVPYQSLLKMFVAERVAAEWRSAASRGSVSNKALQPTTRPRKKSTRARTARG